MHDLIIKTIEPSEWQHEIDQVFKSAYKVEAELLGVEDFPPLSRSSEDLVQCGNRFVGAISGVDLCGVMELEHPDNLGVPTTIASLAVAPKHSRRGIGRRLMNSVLAESGTVNFCLTTGAKNLPAITLYRACGFMVKDRFKTPDGVEMVELVSL